MDTYTFRCAFWGALLMLTITGTLAYGVLHL